MKIKINDIHSVEIEKVSENTYSVSFYELMGNRNVQLGPAEMVSKEIVEEEYGIEV